MHGQGVRRLEDARTTGLVAQPPGLTARPRRITWHAPPPLGHGRRLAEARPSAAALGDQDPLKKELHLFNRAAENCVLQPSACVESLCSRQEVASRPGGWLVDATPSYFSSAAALMQLAAALPRAKLLLLLREPVGRAMSAWKQNLKAGSEPRSFDVAVLDELEAMASRCFPAEAKLLTPIRRSVALASTPQPGGQPAAPTTPPTTTTPTMLTTATTANAAALDASRIGVQPLASVEEALGLAARISTGLFPWEGNGGRWLQELRDQMPKRKGHLPNQHALAQFMARLVGGSEMSCRPSSSGCWLAAPHAGKRADCKRYLTRGLAAAKLREWKAIFGEQLLVLPAIVGQGRPAQDGLLLAIYIYIEVWGL